MIDDYDTWNILTYLYQNQSFILHKKFFWLKLANFLLYTTLLANDT